MAAKTSPNSPLPIFWPVGNRVSCKAGICEQYTITGAMHMWEAIGSQASSLLPIQGIFLLSIQCISLLPIQDIFLLSIQCISLLPIKNSTCPGSGLHGRNRALYLVVPDTPG